MQVEELRDSKTFVAAYGAILLVGACIAWNAELARYAVCPTSSAYIFLWSNARHF